MMKSVKITVVGLGYVGLANALLLAQRNEVLALDIDAERVAMLDRRESPLMDPDITDFLQKKSLNFRATLDKEEAYKDADYVVIATPTDYLAETKTFNTHSVESVIKEALSINSNALIIIRSTIPIGYIDKVRKQFDSNHIIFCPEFLREGQALHDNLYPSRIVVGERSERAQTFANLLLEGAVKKDASILLTGAKEAEAIKLFANTYLAMRVAFFNELDTFSAMHDLSSREIVEGVSLDPRIGLHYNNPSFGYGGYCLPKDTKQLLANYEGVPQRLIEAVVTSNIIRQDFIADEILKRKPNKVGIYRLLMKNNADNCRDSSMEGIIMRLKAEKVPSCIYEPYLNTTEFMGIPIMNDLIAFKETSTLIVANRQTNELNDVLQKLYTRDLFGDN